MFSLLSSVARLNTATAAVRCGAGSSAKCSNASSAVSSLQFKIPTYILVDLVDYTHTAGGQNSNCASCCINTPLELELNGTV